ncbi:endonuclease MutS2 [Olivibacter sp. SDN3]|uniref:endonuclease MutS2 n=1 Tax=Olivibacter sp. SDN3 TaxID=2764720 RepID=UPI00165117CC|nr:endonuclease MutS2 [Olivibacter sp. SDN3]QNL49885.1 endonuclease MutS2 [Olivibacter sp. SDN3]
MIYPENAVDKLGFTEIKALIKTHCLSEMGRQMVDKIQPLYHFDQMNKFMRQTHEFKEILLNDSPLPIEHLYPIRHLAEKARVEGVFLTEEEFFHVFLSLRTVFAVISYFNERDGIYPNLEALFEHLPIEKSIVRSIEQVIDVKGKMKSNASPQLTDILSGIAKAEQEARKTIDQVFKSAQRSGWTADGNLTVRDGRLCIPLLAENKRKVKGFIHDESATGQTVFIEPEEVFHLNNKVRDLEFEKRREIIRILTRLTDELRPNIPLLLAYHGLLSKLDFVRAKALFAIELGAEMPQLVKDAALELINARHPLLTLNFKREKQTVVPLNVKIDEVQRVIVVSGPNAGGKSVCMKTIGLLQMMAQAGLLIPADESSTVGVFRQFFADIGDDQSIESDLSTYSAHLSKMKHFTAHANAKTLVLIDEFGTGTDPQFGGPIAEAVLEVLNEKKIRGVITTHYSNLKNFANATEGLENASMLFDNAAMKPLYILEIGKPGSSYAFEIAQKIGLPQAVLHAAKRKIGAQQKRVDTLLVDLEREKKNISDAKRQLETREQRLGKLQRDNEDLRHYLDENKKDILKQAKIEAQEIIKNANKLIENTISQIKASKADKEKTKELRQHLQQTLDSHQVAEAKIPTVAAKELKEELKMGDWVKIIDSGNVAQVLEVAKDNIILAMGELRSVVKRKRVQKMSNKEVPKAVKRAHSATLTEELAGFYPELDVRGMRTDNALQAIEKHLDKAIMMGYPSLKIIHGKGDGILRKMVRDYLRKYSQVNRMEDEHPDRGGDGITYVYLN